ncbi:MAG: zinc ribbon domain-containing protein [Anaerolineae bacterium]
MRRGWKWVIGIALVVVAAFIILGLLFSYLGFGRGYPAVYGGRAPYGPWMMQRFPMMGGYYMGWLGFGLRALLWLGLFALVILGVISLFRPGGQYWPRDKESTTQPTSPAVQGTKPNAEQAEVKPALERCPSCGHEVQPDWSVCPYCGTKLERPS